MTVATRSQAIEFNVLPLSDFELISACANF